MKLELAKAKVHDDMSEETTCFSAELHYDGILVAHVKNDGRGGSHHIQWTPDARKELAVAIEAEAKRQMDGGDIEMLIDELLLVADVVKSAKRQAKKGFPFTVLWWTKKEMVGELPFFEDCRTVNSKFEDTAALEKWLRSKGAIRYRKVHPSVEAPVTLSAVAA